MLIHKRGEIKLGAVADLLFGLEIYLRWAKQPEVQYHVSWPEVLLWNDWRRTISLPLRVDSPQEQVNELSFFILLYFFS